MIKKDVAIIGCGPSGLTCAIYLKRAKVDFIVFESYMIGGKVNLTADIDNYPPFKHLSGIDLSSKYQEDLIHNEIEVNYEEVKSLKKERDCFLITTNIEAYCFKSVLICSGTKDKTLNIPGEDKFMHKGISFCAVCDGNLFKNKPMAVVGGGNSALEEAIYLSSIASEVYVIHRRNEFRGSKQYLDILKEKKNVKILTPYNIIECKGDNKLREIVLQSSDKKNTLSIKVEVLFEYIGLIPNTDFIEDKSILDESGFVKVNQNLQTEIEGLFASGDVTNKKLRQIVIASGDGAFASDGIIEYLRDKNS